jgi:hypothetical protein
MTLMYIWPVHGDDVTVETNDTTKRRAVTADAFADYRNGAIKPDDVICGFAGAILVIQCCHTLI